ncbi:unnamed protein product [Ilex paraguariensis]|uniref:Uncharacterized protein n=1 Tax=Ilex paraguariensis TaxID=185542 RepID=A0ABC8UJE7_9AQUA
MASLKSGVLVKLLEDMNVEDKGSEEERKSVLLQIRSIIPVLEEGNFWPNRGFYLKVADLSHALYVSLPQEQNDMILSNQLQLGQFIYVKSLERAYPVPLLTGIRPVRGRHPCAGIPEDIVPVTNLVNLLEPSDMESIVEKGVISEKKIIENSSDSRKLFRGLSDSEALIKKVDRVDKRTQGRLRSSSASKARPDEHRIGLKTKRWDVEKRTLNVLGGFQTNRSSSFDNDSDSDDTKSSVSSTSISKRRSWTESEILEVKEIFDSSVAKHEIRPLARSRCRSANDSFLIILYRQVSPVRNVRYDSSDDNLSSTRRRNTVSTRKLVRSSNKSKIPVSKINGEGTSCPVAISSSVNNRKGAETRILWDSLPSTLVKLGKEVTRQRDAALLAAVEALQEACAAERLLNCLSTYSEFPLAEGNDLQPYVDKFFDLQDELAHTRLIMQSLTNINPLRTSGIDSSCTGSVKEALKLAVERKKNASSWIKSAVAVDLSPCFTALKPMPITTDATNAPKKSSTSTHGTKPMLSCSITKQNKNGEFPLALAGNMDDQADWRRGSLCAAANLASSLQDECRKFFLGYVEKYLDEVESKTLSMGSDSQIAGRMYKVKRVNDWLDVISSQEANHPKDGCKEGCALDESEIEACGRVRNQIYRILLKHVERSAKALENINTSD